MSTIGILGAGTWGVALACLLEDNGHDICVWSHTPEKSAELQKTHTHPNLPGISIPGSIQFTASLEHACTNRDLTLLVVPSVCIRVTVHKAKQFFAPEQLVVIASKGIEAETLFTMSEVVENELGEPDAARIVALSGPTHAEEVCRKIPSAIVAASVDMKAAQQVQKMINCPTMRAYTQSDIKGVELCGALKNVIALACGIAVGLGYGDNTKAALITRGIEEIKRLGIALGCNEQTFAGLAGIGDLVVTATSMHSRNNRAGMLLGQGMSAEQATHEIGMVVEGLNALSAAVELSKRHKIEMPITLAVDDVVAERITPSEAVDALMGRIPRSEAS